MSIIFFNVGELGQDGETPRRNKLVVSNSLASLSVPGFLNNTNTSGKKIFPTDVFDVIYNYTATSNFASASAFGTGSYVQCTVKITNGIITLVPWVNPAIIPKVNGTESANVVTASGMAGLLTTSALTTAAGSSYVITWTNTFITSTSVVLLTLSDGTNTTETITLKCTPGNGSATLTIYNTNATLALNGTITLSYLVV